MMPAGARAALFLSLSFTAGCATIPGESLAPSSTQREIRNRLFADGRNVNAQCRQQKILNTEVLDLHPTGSVAEERWTLENCGQRLTYVVSFPASARGAKFQVRPER
jgi:hypothetical protein